MCAIRRLLFVLVVLFLCKARVAAAAAARAALAAGLFGIPSIFNFSDAYSGLVYFIGDEIINLTSLAGLSPDTAKGGPRSSCWGNSLDPRCIRRCDNGGGHTP